MTRTDERLVVLEVEGDLDGFGRQLFTATWHDGDRERGQVFRALLDDAAYWRRNGYRVEIRRVGASS